jgi:hypothetical protein
VTDLHPIVEAMEPLKRHRAAEAELERRAAELRERYLAAEAEHEAAMAEHRRALSEGTAGPPPQWHPPVDMGAVQHQRAQLREQRRAALAECAAEAEAALRDREAVLLDRVEQLVAELIEPAHAEMAQLLASLRQLYAARGVPASQTSIPSSVTLGDLVERAVSGQRLIPDDPAALDLTDPRTRRPIVARR